MSGGAARSFGVVSLVQVQPNGLIIDSPGPGPAKQFDDASRRVEVDRLQISDRWIEAALESGKHVLDIHHLDHPRKESDNDDLVCVGFSAPYDAMCAGFGEHMTPLRPRPSTRSASPNPAPSSVGSVYNARTATCLGPRVGKF